MTRVQAFYAAVRETEARLRGEHGEYLYTTSLDDPARGLTGGSVAEVSVRLAAERIVEGEARVSTPGEIAAFRERGERFRRSIAAADNSYKYRSAPQ